MTDTRIITKCFYCDFTQVTDKRVNSRIVTCDNCYPKKTINESCTNDCKGLFVFPSNYTGTSYCSLNKTHITEVSLCSVCNIAVSKKYLYNNICSICTKIENAITLDLGLALSGPNNTYVFRDYNNNYYAKTDYDDRNVPKSDRLNRALVQAYIDFRLKKVEAKIDNIEAKVDKLTNRVEKLISMIEFNPGDGPEFVAAQERFNDNTKKI